MKKYDYQTCLRLPVILKEEMTTICDEYRINESDLMRRAISEFVQMSFPPKTGPLFWYRKGNEDGSKTAFGRGHTEASARDRG